jgi:hypothetical protein
MLSSYDIMSVETGSVTQNENPIGKLREMMMHQRDLTLARIDGLSQFSEASQANLDTFSGHINSGLIPVIYANHQSFADEIVLSLVTREILKQTQLDKLRGFLLPVAASIGSGDQGQDILDLAEIFEHTYRERGFREVPIVRKEDVKKYSMKRAPNIQASSNLTNAPNEGYGLAIFPEATMHGGRKDQDGRIFGLQKVVVINSFLGLVKEWRNEDRGTQRRESVILPVGIDGSHRILDPQTGDIQQDASRMISGCDFPEPPVTISVGEPLTTENWETMGDIHFFMGKVAALLPPEARGYYASAIS